MPQDRGADAPSLKAVLGEPWVMLALAAAVVVLVAALFLH